MLVKGELKGHNSETGELRIELRGQQPAGFVVLRRIARQIRIKQRGASISLSLLQKQQRVARKVVVAPGLIGFAPRGGMHGSWLSRDGFRAHS